MMDGHSLKVLRQATSPDFEALYGAPYFLFHRVDLHTELKRMASEPRPNTSAVARIHLLSEVVNLDLDGSMTLADGRTLRKDLIVVADGIRVRIYLCLLFTSLVGHDLNIWQTRFASVVAQGESVRAVPTGTAVYRFLIPTEKLLADEQTRHIYEGDKFSLSIAPHKDERLVWYPCRRYVH